MLDIGSTITVEGAEYTVRTPINASDKCDGCAGDHSISLCRSFPHCGTGHAAIQYIPKPVYPKLDPEDNEAVLVAAYCEVLEAKAVYDTALNKFKDLAKRLV